MNLFLLGFVIQLVVLYGMILFSDYLREAVSNHSAVQRQRPIKARLKKR